MNQMKHMPFDLLDQIGRGRGERCADLAARLHVSPTTVRYVWDHEAELRAAFGMPALLRPADGLVTRADDQ